MIKKSQIDTNNPRQSEVYKVQVNKDLLKILENSEVVDLYQDLVKGLNDMFPSSGRRWMEHKIIKLLTMLADQEHEAWLWKKKHADLLYRRDNNES
jgi:hypothetical protein